MRGLFYGFVCCTMLATSFLSPASVVQADDGPVLADAEAKSLPRFVLRRETKLAGLRIAIREKANRAPRGERRILNRVLGDADMQELVLAEVEWLESQEGVSIAEDGERRPVQDFLKFIIDNWDQIKQIIEFLSGLFAGDGDIGMYAPWQDTIPIRSPCWMTFRSDRIRLVA